MRYLPTVARLTLGTILLLFGADYVIGFMPETAVSPDGLKFLEALMATGYMFPLIKTVETTTGVLLLTSTAVPFAVAIFAPVAANIVLYHVMLDANGLSLAAVIAALEVYLVWEHRSTYQALFAVSDTRRPAATSDYATAHR
jgi:hypothetical protein